MDRTILRNFDKKANLPLSIAKVSNRLFIQMPNTRHIGKELLISLFNTSGRIVYTTKTKMKARKFNFPISGLPRGIYHTKITSGKSSEYYGSVAIIR